MNKKFVSIWFPFLLTDWVAIKRPEFKGRPLVITELSHGRQIITDGNPLAFSKGIHRGMTLADARALHPGIKALNERKEVVPALLEKIAAWCIRYTSFAAVDLPDGIILDATGCPWLWGGDEKYMDEIRNRFMRKGYQVSLALAPNPAAARAFARFSNKKIITPAELLPYILSLPPEALRLEAETVAMLHKLGLGRLEKIISLPATVLRNRFGKLIGQRIAEISGKREEILQAVILHEPYRERLASPELICDRKGIEFALEKTLKTLCGRLQLEGNGIRKASFRIYKYDDGIQEVSINTHRPSTHFNHLFKLFENKLDLLEPGAGIELFILEANVVEKNDPLQEKLWENAAGLQNIHLSEFLDKVSDRVGNEAIKRYLPAEHHWPERSYRAAELVEAPTIPWQNKYRPVELLERPERIEVTAPVPDYPPMLFWYKNRLHRIKKADGPERIEREWWLDKGEHRDYYSLEDEEGNRFWVFRLGHYSESGNWQWFLCGYFP